MSDATAYPTRVRLRPTRVADLGYVLKLERDPRQPPAQFRWEAEQHEAALRFADYRHCIVEAGPGLERAGFAILAGCRHPQQNVEIRRLVTQQPGQGHGRAALQHLKQLAFDELAAERLWLELREGNVAARILADTEGFVLEGRLRDAVRAVQQPGAGRESLLVLSMLRPEFLARRAAAQELRA